MFDASLVDRSFEQRSFIFQSRIIGDRESTSVLQHCVVPEIAWYNAFSLQICWYCERFCRNFTAKSNQKTAMFCLWNIFEQKNRKTKSECVYMCYQSWWMVSTPVWKWSKVRIQAYLTTSSLLWLVFYSQLKKIARVRLMEVRSFYSRYNETLESLSIWCMTASANHVAIVHNETVKKLPNLFCFCRKVELNGVGRKWGKSSPIDKWVIAMFPNFFRFAAPYK